MIWSEIEGWFLDGDVQFVSDICSRIVSGVVVEIGVFAGRSTAVMSPICMANSTKYYAIDNFHGSTDPRDAATKGQQTRDIQSLFEANMKAIGTLDHITVVKANSDDAVKLFDNCSVDFCFIDADHTPHVVLSDIQRWWPKIKPGGILGGHDYQAPLGRVVDSFARENRVKVFSRGTCWGITAPTDKEHCYGI